MTANREDTDSILRSLTQDAIIKIALAVQEVACEFITSGGYGSVRMYTVSNEKVAKTFRNSAGLMAAHAKRCVDGTGAAVADLVEAHLYSLIDHTIQQRTAHIEAGRIASQDAVILCADLRRDLKRTKNAVVRLLHHLPSDMPVHALTENGAAARQN